MLQFIFFLLLFVLGAYCYKKLRQELAKLDEEDRRKAKLEKRDEGVKTLKKDPKTGVYRMDD